MSHLNPWGASAAPQRGGGRRGGRQGGNWPQTWRLHPPVFVSELRSGASTCCVQSHVIRTAFPSLFLYPGEPEPGELPVL